MKNIWIICRKELRSYFTSPVAYILLVMFAFRHFRILLLELPGLHREHIHGKPVGGRTISP